MITTFEDTYFNCKNLLLIDTSIKNYNIFNESINSNTYALCYSNKDKIVDILLKIENKFTNINRIGIVFSNDNYDGECLFLENKPFFSNDLVFTDINTTFIVNLLNKFNVKNIDYLGCNTLNYVNWRSYYDFISNNTETIIGASDNYTGNLKFGGDWIMETTGENIENIYFSKNINYYTYLLGSYGNSTFIVTENNNLYGIGYNFYGGLGINKDGTNYTSGFEYETTFQQITISGNTSIPKKIITEQLFTLILMVDGTLWASGTSIPDNYAFGLGNTTIKTFTKVPSPLNKKILDIETYSYQWPCATYIITDDNLLYAVGNTLAPLYVTGTAVQSSFTQITLPSEITKVKAMCSGKNNFAIIGDNNYAYAYGDNTFGQLGLGYNSSYEYTFKKVQTPTTVKMISPGDQHMLMVLTNGELWGTGSGKKGQLMVNDLNYITYNPVKLSVPEANVDIETIYAIDFLSYVHLTNGKVFRAGAGSGFNSNYTNIVNKSNTVEQFSPSSQKQICLSNKQLYGSGLYWAYGGRITDISNTFSLATTPGPIKLISGVYTFTTKLKPLLYANNTLFNSIFNTEPIILMKIGTTDFNFGMVTDSDGIISYSVLSTTNGTYVDSNGKVTLGQTVGVTYIKVDVSETNTYASKSRIYQIYMRQVNDMRFNGGSNIFYMTPNSVINLNVISSNTSTINYSLVGTSDQFFVASNGNVTTLSTITIPSNYTINISQATNDTYAETSLTATVYVLYRPTVSTLNFPNLSRGPYPNIRVGDSFNITPTSNSTGAFSYSTSPSNYVTIDNSTGILTATNVYAGTITISWTQSPSATYVGASGTFTLNNILQGQSTLSTTTTTFSEKKVGDTFNSGITLSNGNGTITYTSNPSSYVSIDASGNITCLKYSSTPITITANVSNTPQYLGTNTSIRLSSISKGTSTLTLNGSQTLPIIALNNTLNLLNYFTYIGEGPLSYTITIGSTPTTAYATITNNILTGILITQNQLTIYISSPETTNYLASNTIALTIPSIVTYITNITFSSGNTFSGKRVGDNFNLGLQSNNSQPYAFNISPSNYVSVDSSGNVTLLQYSTNPITINISQNGNSNYSYSSVTATITNIQKGYATINIDGSNSSKNFTGKKINDIFNLNLQSNNTSIFNFSGMSNYVDINATYDVTCNQATSQDIVISISQNEDANYLSTFATATIKGISKISPDLKINGQSNSYTYSNIQYGSTFNLNVTSNSSGLITYNSNSSYLLVDNSGNVTTTNVYSGTMTITINQSETTNYLSTTATITINNIVKGSPTIIVNNNNLFTPIYNTPFNLNVSSNSSGLFSYSSTPTGYVSIDGSGNVMPLNTTPITNPKTLVTITITQQATNLYNQATQQVSFEIGKATPTMTINENINKTLADVVSPIQLNPIMNVSGGTITYTIKNGSENILSLNSDNSINILGTLGVGYVDIYFSGTSLYTSITKTISIIVSKMVPSFTIQNRTITKTFLDTTPFPLDVISDSDGNITYTSTSDKITIINFNQAQISNNIPIGTYTINISQDATDIYTSNTDTITINITGASPTITNLPTNITVDYNNTVDILIDPISNSTGSFGYAIDNTNVATIVTVNNKKYVRIRNTGTANTTNLTVTQYASGKFFTKIIAIPIYVTKPKSNLSVLNGSSDTFNIRLGETLDLKQFLSGTNGGTITYSTTNVNNITVNATTGIINALLATNSFVTVKISEAETATTALTEVTIKVNILKKLPQLQLINNNNSNNFSLQLGQTLDLNHYLSTNSPVAYTFSNNTPTNVSINLQGIITPRIISSQPVSITIYQQSNSEYDSDTITINIIVIKDISSLQIVNDNGTNTFALSVNSSIDLSKYISTNSTGQITYTTFNNTIINVNSSTGNVTLLTNIPSAIGSISVTITQAETSSYSQKTVTAIIKQNTNLTINNNGTNIFDLYVNDSIRLLDYISTSSDGTISYSINTPNTVEIINLNDGTIKLKASLLNQNIQSIVTITQAATSIYAEKIITAVIKEIPNITFNGNNAILTANVGDIINLVDHIDSNSNGLITYTTSDTNVNLDPDGTVTILSFTYALIPINIDFSATLTLSSGSISALINVVKKNPNIRIINNSDSNVFNVFNGGILALSNFIISDNTVSAFNYTMVTNPYVSIDTNSGILTGLSINNIIAPIKIIVSQQETTLYMRNSVDIYVNVILPVNILPYSTITFNNLTNSNIFELYLNEKLNIHNLLLSNSTGLYTYTSDSPNIVSVNNLGEITVLSTSTIRPAIITITQAADTNFRETTVKAFIIPLSIQNTVINIANKTITKFIKQGKIFSLGAISNNPAPIVYSETSKILDIDSNGMVTLISKGKAVITIKQAASRGFSEIKTKVTIVVK